VYIKITKYLLVDSTKCYIHGIIGETLNRVNWNILTIISIAITSYTIPVIRKYYVCILKSPSIFWWTQPNAIFME